MSYANKASRRCGSDEAIEFMYMGMKSAQIRVERSALFVILITNPID